MSFEEIEKKANEVIVNFQVTKPPVNPRKIADFLGLEVLEKDLNRDEISGLIAMKGDKSIIMVNRGDVQTRKQFTIAHELGHYILHRNDEGLFVDKKEPTIFYRKENSKRAETEANVFAANLLMPYSLIKREILENHYDLNSDTCVEKMALKFNVSISAMTYRLHNLELI